MRCLPRDPRLSDRCHIVGIVFPLRVAGCRVPTQPVSQTLWTTFARQSPKRPSSESKVGAVRVLTHFVKSNLVIAAAAGLAVSLHAPRLDQLNSFGKNWCNNITRRRTHGRRWNPT